MSRAVSKRVELVRSRNKPPRSRSDKNDRNVTMWKKILDDVCDQCSLHGLNHIIREDRSPGEKIFWAVTVACAVLLATYAIVESWKTYDRGSIDTVVETTFFNYADIAFPMVTVCDSSRVDWERVTRLTAQDVPQVHPSLLPTVKRVLKTFSVLSYGDFDDFHELQNVSVLYKLKNLNLTELLVKVMRPCHEVFCCGGCWWNFKEVNCCEVFEIQRTEFGLCYSFNSDFSEYSKARLGANSGRIGTFWRTETGELRPRRTGDKGQWSGVRFYTSTVTPSQVPPGVNAKPSIRIMMSEPRGAPLGSDIVVMAGTFGNVNVWGDRIYNTERTRTVDPRKRNCYFADEGPAGMGTKHYMRRNCKASCYMNHVIQHCGCYLEFMFALMSSESTTMFFTQ